MFAMSDRVSPWYARISRSSDERTQTTALRSASSFTSISGRWRYCNLPSLPSTVISRFATFTFTPEGSGIGFLPMRDIYGCPWSVVCGLLHSVSNGQRTTDNGRFSPKTSRLDRCTHLPGLLPLPHFTQHFAAEFDVLGEN